jgi:hypothetical protein
LCTCVPSLAALRMIISELCPTSFNHEWKKPFLGKKFNIDVTDG